MSATLPLPRLALVDLDGTLVDTIPDIAWSVDRMLATLGMAPAGESRVREWVGNGTEALVRRALALALARDGEPDPALLARATTAFTELYGAHVCDRSRIFDGALAGLDFLAETGAHVGCVTNKSDRFTRALLAELGLEDRFALVVSGDTLPRRKPDPMPLLHAARHFGVEPGDAVLIGDSANDVQAARAAGFRVVCVTYGYNHGDDIRDSAPDALLDTLADLPAVFAYPRAAGSAG